MDPMSLARLANALFCDFGRRLVQCNPVSLFKIENMGDAYVCCGWLPDPDQTAADAESAAESEEEKTIHTILYMARGILEAAKQHRRKYCIDLHVHIGIGTGTCVAGVMGQLQARFQVLRRLFCKHIDWKRTPRLITCTLRHL